MCIQSSECDGDLDCSPSDHGGSVGCQAQVLLVVIYVPTCPPTVPGPVDVGEVGLGHTTGLSMQLKQNGSRQRSSDETRLFSGGRACYSAESQIVACGTKQTTMTEFSFSDLVPRLQRPCWQGTSGHMELDRDQYMSLHDVGIPRPLLSLERQRGCSVTGSGRDRVLGPGDSCDKACLWRDLERQGGGYKRSAQILYIVWAIHAAWCVVEETGERYLPPQLLLPLAKWSWGRSISPGMLRGGSQSQRQ